VIATVKTSPRMPLVRSAVIADVAEVVLVVGEIVTAALL
jgi:hypothetical protein